MLECPPSAERVEQHAKHRWETILNILVGIGDNKVIGNNPQNRATSALLVQVGLIRMDDGGRPVITAEGFKFLFQDIHSQIWQIIIAYLEGVEQRGLSKKPVLMFLFKLSFLTLNKPYSTSSFNAAVSTECVVGAVLPDVVGQAPFERTVADQTGARRRGFHHRGDDV